MPLAFSFFNTSFLKPRPPETAKDDAAPVETTVPVPEKKSPPPLPASPFPITSPFAGSPLLWNEDRAPILPAETVTIHEQEEPPPLIRLPERKPATGQGIAAMAVSQGGLEAPPLNSRNPFASRHEPAPILVEERPAAPTPPPLESSVETLRGDMLNEIEQVKNDLFGAVMGVSALKDRLDGLEQQVATLPPPPPAADIPGRPEVEQWTTGWLAEHLEPSLERALVPLLEKIALKSKLRLPFTPADAATALSQPPVILTTTPV